MRYLNISQLSEKLGGRSFNSIYNDIQNGQLPKPIKLGNRNIWPEPTVDEWLARLAEQQGAHWTCGQAATELIARLSS